MFKRTAYTRPRKIFDQLMLLWRKRPFQ